MRGALLLGLAITAGGPQPPRPEPVLTLQIHVFDGPVDVTTGTRIAVHPAGDRTRALARTRAGDRRVELTLPPGLYDVQATHLQDRRVLTIHWALRLVVMPYPDEHGRHLEVINLQNDYGALEIRTEGSALDSIDLYRLGDRSQPLPVAIADRDYRLYVVRAGAYDLRAGRDANARWKLGLDVPPSRTRMVVVP